MYILLETDKATGAKVSYGPFHAFLDADTFRFHMLCPSKTYEIVLLMFPNTY